MKYYIYGLLSTRDNIIRYIGQTKSSLKRRLSEHKCDALTRNIANHKCNWIRKEISDGFEINITMIEETDSEKWAEREVHWIKELSVSNNLVNELKGGNCGGIGGKLQNYLSYSEAKEYIKIHMPFVNTYKEYIKEYNDHYETYKNLIPKAPQKVYALRNEWKGWGDYLVQGNISDRNRHYSFIPFQEMKDLNVKHNIKTLKQYREFIKENKINAPYNPSRGYSDKWVDLYDFLGIKKTKICNYNDFCDILKCFISQLTNEYSYRKLYKNGMLPSNVPAHPMRVYKKTWGEIVSDIKNK